MDIDNGSTPIEQLNISIRLLNGLMRFGILTVEDLLNTSPEQLLKSRAFGKKSYHELLALLSELKEGKPEQKTWQNDKPRRTVLGELLKTSYEDCSAIYKKTVIWNFLKTQWDGGVGNICAGKKVPYQIYGINNYQAFVDSLEEQGLISGSLAKRFINHESETTIEDVLPKIKGTVLFSTDESILYNSAVELDSMYITYKGQIFLDRYDYLEFVLDYNISETELDNYCLNGESEKQVLLRLMEEKGCYYFACKLALDLKDYTEYSRGLCGLIRQEINRRYSPLTSWYPESKLEWFLRDSKSKIDLGSVESEFSDLDEKDQCMIYLILAAANNGWYSRDQIQKCYGKTVEEGLAHLREWYMSSIADMPLSVNEYLGFSVSCDTDAIPVIQQIYERIISYFQRAYDPKLVASCMKIDLYRHDRMNERQSIFQMTDWRRVLNLSFDLLLDCSKIIRGKYGIHVKDIYSIERTYIPFMQSDSPCDFRVSRQQEKILNSFYVKWFFEQTIHNLSGDSESGSKEAPSYISYCRKRKQDEKYGLKEFSDNIAAIGW